MNNLIIRPETPADYHEAEALTRRAFWNLHVPGCNEHYLVHRLRRDCAFVPELSWQGQFDEKVHFYSVGPYSRSTFVFRKNTVDSSPTVDAFCRFLIEETAKITQKQ